MMARMHLRKVWTDEPVSVACELERTSAILVVMPREAHQFEQANFMLGELQDGAAPLKIHVLVNEIYKTWLDRSLIKEALIYTEKDFGRLTDLPRKELVDQVASQECNLVVDMNLEFNLVAAYLSALSLARIRVALERDDNRFYNVLIRIRENDPRELYRRYVEQILQSLLNSLRS